MNRRKINRVGRYKYLITVVAVLLLGGLLFGCGGAGEEGDAEAGGGQTSFGLGSLTSTEDIGLYDVDGGGWCYAFTYRGEEFRAQYYYDNWTIYDSYKITNGHDMKIICQALIDINPVHGSDYESYRTAKDMKYEWKQHNLAYKYLPEDNPWRQNAMNVDFDPEDQGRSFEEMYEARTGQDIDVEQYVREKVEDGELVDELKQLLHRGMGDE